MIAAIRALCPQGIAAAKADQCQLLESSAGNAAPKIFSPQRATRNTN